MNKIELQKHQQDWYNENAPFGRDLGYPECCIKEFCDQPPILLQMSKPTVSDKERYRAACINGKYTGFIPCAQHAKEILSGKITLASLIKNRNPKYPNFPNL